MNICEKCLKEHDGTFASGRFCSRSCANTKIHSEETKRKISNSVKNSEIFYKRNAPNKLKRITKICPICNNSFITVTYKNDKSRIFCSRKCFIFDQKNGHKYSKKVSGGYRKGSCKSHGGYYKNIWCDSTYELIWIIYNLDHNIQFERNDIGFPYTTPDGKKHLYYPDFIQDNEYIEIKNYLKENDQYKISNFPHKLTILFGKDLQKHFEYVYSVYGKDLKSLYSERYKVQN
jgi:endogenous inhibitor of DNA gyrase (YacG/DUF329 family)